MDVKHENYFWDFRGFIGPKHSGSERDILLLYRKSNNLVDF